MIGMTSGKNLIWFLFIRLKPDSIERLKIFCPLQGLKLVKNEIPHKIK
jgi:hypothetical protein